MRDAPPLPPHIPDYELLRVIGRGSYGIVWLAQSVTGLYRAVKVVSSASFEDPQPYEREFRGIKEFAAISLQEPRQLALLHVGRNDRAGFFYYVMELADDAKTGREIDPTRYIPYTLRELRAQRTCLPPGETLTLAVDLARALEGLHVHGLVHRDIKPSNIIFVGGVPKLADIGLVTSAATDSLSISRVGNPGYMPPDFPGVPSADVYGLGKVLYELATGRNREDYPRLPADLDRMPDRKTLLELNEILMRACAAEPQNRYPDAGALKDDLLLLQAGKSVRKLRAVERHLERTLRVAAALAIAATIAGAGAWAEHRRAAKAEAALDAIARRSIYAGTLAQVQRAIEAADYGRARRLLKEAEPRDHTPDLRGPEWHALHQRALGDPSIILRPGGPEIDRLALSPDGRLVAVHDEDKTVVLYDANTCQPVRRIEGVQRLAGFSADGQWIVGTSSKPAGAPQRWLASTGEAPRPGSAGLRGIRPIAPKGLDSMVALIDAQPSSTATGVSTPLTLIVWDFTRDSVTLRRPLDLPGTQPPWEFFRASASPAGDQLVIACVKGRRRFAQQRLTRIDLNADAVPRHYEVPGFLASVLSCVPANGGIDWIAVETSSGRALTFQPQSDSWVPSAHAFPIGTTVIAPFGANSSPGILIGCNSEVRASGGADASTSGDRFRGHDTLVSALTPLNDNDVFFAATKSGELRRWSRRTQPPAPMSRACWDSEARPTQILYSLDGAHLFLPDKGGHMSMLDARSLASVASVPEIHLPLWIGPRHLWGLSTAGKELVEWDHVARTIRRSVAVGDEPISRAAISDNGAWACTIAQDGRMKLAELSRPQITLLDIPGNYRDEWLSELSDDGSLAWGANNRGELVCFALPAGRQNWTVRLPARATRVCRLAQAGLLAVALENGEIQFFDQATGRFVQRCASGSSAAQDLRLSRDGTRLIAAGFEGDLQILAPAWNTHLASLATGANSPLHVLAVAPDGSSVASLTKNGILHVTTLR